jgi:pyrimidine operon attenuation protein/uracil phosphoribosyltransferase
MPTKRTTPAAKKKVAAKPAKSAKKPATKGKPDPSRARSLNAPEPKKAAPGKTRTVMSEREVEHALEMLADQIHRDFPNSAGLMVLGIRTRGALIADRLRELLKSRYDAPVGLGTLDITLYRDDLSALGPQPNVRDSEIPFDITGANVILVDDVLYTGRTIRAALDEIVDFGRPALIRLLVLVDRGHREYPIKADYCGLTISTDANESVQVCLSEIEEEDGVIVTSPADMKLRK